MWNPIKTAPENELVVGYNPEWPGPFVLEREGGQWFFNIDEKWGTPTHWMRIPDPYGESLDKNPDP